MDVVDISQQSIFLVKGFLKQHTCEYIIDIMSKLNMKYSDWCNGNNVKCYFIDTVDIVDYEIRVEVDNIIYEKMIQFQEYLNREFDLKIKSDSGYCLRKIYGETRKHIDGLCPDINDNSIRVLSCVIALNDDFEGGEFSFPNQKKKIKLSKGDLIAFPPYWTHPHHVSPPSGNSKRYTINTWLKE